MVSELN